MLHLSSLTTTPPPSTAISQISDTVSISLTVTGNLCSSFFTVNSKYCIHIRRVPLLNLHYEKVNFSHLFEFDFRFRFQFSKVENVDYCRPGLHRQNGRHIGGSGFKGMVTKLSIAAIVLLICTFSLFYSSSNQNVQSIFRSEVLLKLFSSESLRIFVMRNSANFFLFIVEQIRLEELWSNADSSGWRPSSSPRSHWPRIYLFL